MYVQKLKIFLYPDLERSNAIKIEENYEEKDYMASKMDADIGFPCKTNKDCKKLCPDICYAQKCVYDVCYCKC